MNIGNRIKEYRKKAKLSQKELAQKILEVREIKYEQY